jgi:hypothetical protein
MLQTNKVYQIQHLKPFVCIVHSASLFFYTSHDNTIHVQIQRSFDLQWSLP